MIHRRNLLGATGMLLGLSAGPVLAQEQRAGDIVVSRGWTRAVPNGAPTAAGYLTLRNEGSAPDRLLSAASPMARSVELHATSMVDGVARMRPLAAGVPIPPGETVRLEPGNIHAMLVGPSGSFARGGRVPLVLRFERAGEVAVDLSVEAPGARTGGHPGH
ncbi:copper chaperone PCu(A)C [Muricoccus radiodurans]|uniref:copper chaperone PCu(A)C n=1 Tax=Muricoccus radiodurans TaxID=2231721 RepID=UPI003CEC6E54